MLQSMETPHIQWQRQIEMAPTHGDVITIVRRYLATIPQTDLLTVPSDCRPSLPSTGEEIGRWAVHLVTAEMKLPPDDPGAGLLHQLAVVFSGANTRFAQLAQEARMLRPPPPGK